MLIEESGRVRNVKIQREKKYLLKSIYFCFQLRLVEVTGCIELTNNELIVKAGIRSEKPFIQTCQQPLECPTFQTRLQCHFY